MFQCLLFDPVQWLTLAEVLGQQAALEQLVPALDDFGIAPGQALFQVYMQNDMIVVAHHRIGGDIDGKDASQHQQAVFDPLPAMFETADAVAVLAAQKSTAHAA